jgi:DNA invertase Pin-like site-specific DNA recombinase
MVTVVAMGVNMTAKREKSPRFVAYYRVSTGAQGRSGLGINAQQETVRRFLASESGGWLPLASFTETESGRKSNRPELNRALAMCRARRATLVVAKVDRLTRSAAFLHTVMNSGVEVRFCDLPDVKGATGRFLLQQMASVAELEAGLIGERTKAALAEKVARDGQWDRRAKHHLVPGVGQSAATQAARERACKRANDLRDLIEHAKANGASSLRAIAAALNEADVEAPRGGPWGPSSVRNVLARLE